MLGDIHSCGRSVPSSSRSSPERYSDAAADRRYSDAAADRLPANRRHSHLGHDESYKLQYGVE